MSNEQMLDLLTQKKVEKKELIIVKRTTPLLRDYLKGDVAKKHVNAINRMIYFYRNFETRFEVKRGDVFVAGFEFECGNELNGFHFVVAILDSSPLSQLVTIVPLHSAKMDRELNPCSEVYVGEIPGVTNKKKAVAIINQIRTIDKRRIFDKAAIEHFNQYVQSENFVDYGQFTAQHKYFFRLSDEQLKKVHKAVRDYIYNGYIRHE